MNRSPANLDLFGWEPPEPSPSPGPPAAVPAPAAPATAGAGAATAEPEARATRGERRPRGPGEPATAELLAAVNRAGGKFRDAVLTSNRHVVISAGDRGATLRINRSFLEAPEPVLAAVGQFFASRPGAVRNRARRAIREFLATARPPEPRRRRPRRHHPLDTPLLQRLQREFDRVNAESFGGELPRVPIFLSRAMRRRNGHFSASAPEIVISRHLCVAAVDGEAERTLRHEMIHLWQHHTGAQLGHGRDFRRWARRLDVHPRATRPVRWADCAEG